jgi:hypothetical protein
LKISADELEISAEDLDYSNEAKEKITCEYGTGGNWFQRKVFW